MGQSSHGLFDWFTINLFNFSKFIFILLTRSESSSDSSVASVSTYVKSEVSSISSSSMPLGMDIISPSKPLMDDRNRMVVICSSPFCDLVRDEIGVNIIHTYFFLHNTTIA